MNAIEDSALRRAIHEDDDVESIDQDQLDEYNEMIDALGSFPDKVKINGLSMVAEDHSNSKKSAQSLYDSIRRRLLEVSSDRMLPLVYVLDSIVKNAKGCFVEIMEKDAENWLPIVHRNLEEPQRTKLEKVWRTWNEFRIFSEDRWKAMGVCFDRKISAKTIGSTSHQVAGISRTNDGTLLLSVSLRNEMQSVLDELQSSVDNELEKVSLERLADINQDLLANIKKAAEESMHNRKNGSNDETEKDDETKLPYFFTETRSQEALARSKAWQALKWDHLETAHTVVARLQHAVRETAESEALYSQQEALSMIQYLAAVATTASLLTSALEKIKNSEDRQDHKKQVSFPGLENVSGTVPSRGAQVDPFQFTNDGIKTKNSAAVGLLYEVGLPFVSSTDGRRFSSQLELSRHLDALFKKNQIEKSMARTEERGWYACDMAWLGEEVSVTGQSAPGQGAETTTDSVDDIENREPEKCSVPADEARDRCIICGINFKMFFDNDDGIYRYSNCRDIEVSNDDDVALSESEIMLAHVSCWRGLGSPEVLSGDQVLEGTLPR